MWFSENDFFLNYNIFYDIHIYLNSFYLYFKNKPKKIGSCLIERKFSDQKKKKKHHT